MVRHVQHPLVPGHGHPHREVEPRLRPGPILVPGRGLARQRIRVPGLQVNLPDRIVPAVGHHRESLPTSQVIRRVEPRKIPGPIPEVRPAVPSKNRLLAHPNNVRRLVIPFPAPPRRTAGRQRCAITLGADRRVRTRLINPLPSTSEVLRLLVDARLAEPLPDRPCNGHSTNGTAKAITPIPVLVNAAPGRHHAVRQRPRPVARADPPGRARKAPPGCRLHVLVRGAGDRHAVTLRGRPRRRVGALRARRRNAILNDYKAITTNNSIHTPNSHPRRPGVTISHGSSTPRSRHSRHPSRLLQQRHPGMSPVGRAATSAVHDARVIPSASSAVPASPTSSTPTPMSVATEKKPPGVACACPRASRTTRDLRATLSILDGAGLGIPTIHPKAIHPQAPRASSPTRTVGAGA
eukprot:768787-Hanusia_phi.AAC.7